MNHKECIEVLREYYKRAERQAGLVGEDAVTDMFAFKYAISVLENEPKKVRITIEEI